MQDLLERLAHEHASSRVTWQRRHSRLVAAGLIPPRAPGRAARPMTARDGLLCLFGHDLERRTKDVVGVLRGAWELPFDGCSPEERPAVICMADEGDSGPVARIVSDTVEHVEACLGVATAEPLGPALESIASPAALASLEASFERLAELGGRTDVTVSLLAEPLAAAVEITAEIAAEQFISARRTLHYGQSESLLVEQLLAQRDDPEATEQERAAARRALARHVWHDRPREIARLRLDDILTIGGMLREGQ